MSRVRGLLGLGFRMAEEEPETGGSEVTVESNRSNISSSFSHQNSMSRCKLRPYKLNYNSFV